MLERLPTYRSALRGPEISDVIVDIDPATFTRRPVGKSQLVEQFRANGNRWAARIVEQIPSVDGTLAFDAVDALLIRVHSERQRLSEEFEQGLRTKRALQPLVEVLSRGGREVRVVDIGCANGYAVRWLAKNGGLGDRAEFIGVDYNGALIDEARRLSAEEGLDTRFEVADGLSSTIDADVVMTTGVIHHFQGAELDQFFEQHCRAGVSAFLHFDLQPNFVTHIGSWLLHRARVELPLTRHDGVLSGLRAHDKSLLLNSARSAMPEFQVRMMATRFGPFPRTLPYLLGVLPQYWLALPEAYRRRAWVG